MLACLHLCIWSFSPSYSNRFSEDLLEILARAGPGIIKMAAILDGEIGELFDLVFFHPGFGQFRWNSRLTLEICQPADEALGTCVFEPHCHGHCLKSLGYRLNVEF